MNGIYTKTIQKVKGSNYHSMDDQLAIEEPLEIQLSFVKECKPTQQSISITMRTPGQDVDLALGFLYTEGMIQSFDQVKSAEHMPSWNPEMQGNRILVELAPDIVIDLKKLERHFYTTSSCGVCGKASIDAIRVQKSTKLPKDSPVFPSNIIYQLPDLLREQQALFEHTGGIHAAALFDTSGKLHFLREDVGRHNAVDKIVGAALASGSLPLRDHLLLVSGRASFELVQKALMADISILAAVGAPSSLAVQLAEESGMSVLGFVKGQQFNIYTHPQRIRIGEKLAKASSI